MIIWKGYGILVLVIAIVIGALVSSLFSSIGSNEEVGAAMGALLSGVAIWFLGNKFNAPGKARTLIDKQTGQEIIDKPDHSLFFIKMQYWAFIVAGIGVVMLINILRHGTSGF